MIPYADKTIAMISVSKTIFYLRFDQIHQDFTCYLPGLRFDCKDTVIVFPQHWQKQQPFQGISNLIL